MAQYKLVSTAKIKLPFKNLKFETSLWSSKTSCVHSYPFVYTWLLCICYPFMCTLSFFIFVLTNWTYMAYFLITLFFSIGTLMQDLVHTRQAIYPPLSCNLSLQNKFSISLSVSIPLSLSQQNLFLQCTRMAVKNKYVLVQYAGMCLQYQLLGMLKIMNPGTEAGLGKIA